MNQLRKQVSTENTASSAESSSANRLSPAVLEWIKKGIERVSNITKIAAVAAVPFLVSCEPPNKSNLYDDPSVQATGQESNEKLPYDRFIQPGIAGNTTVFIHINYPEPVYVQVNLLNSNESYTFQSKGGKNEFSKDTGNTIDGFTVKVAKDPEMRQEIPIIQNPKEVDTESIWGVNHATNASIE